MAEGLRIIGKCPRCRGELSFADQVPEPERPETQAISDELPPHLVLGLPRR